MKLPKFFIRAFLAIFVVLFHFTVAHAEVHPKDDVRLVLQITVDQLRGDTMTRFGDRFVEGGFRYFFDNGIYYSNAHYDHANTETAPGHATLVTGAYPSAHGIVANDWINANTGEFVYNTEDERHSYIGANPKPHQGVSPRNLLSTTIADELIVHTAGRSRSFGVSPKDRGAILPAGHAGKAFWYNNRAGGFVSSTYYYDEYPDWVNKWNAKKLADGYRGRQWTLLNDRSTYIAKDLDDRPYESDFDALGRTFPHQYGDGSSKYFYTVLYVTPAASAMAVDFAKTLIDAEKVGQGNAVDFLAVSLSSPDMGGHLFGQSSLEYEDAVLRTDQQIADLLAHIDARVGLDKTLVVLSADHGGQEAPEYMQSLGMDAGRFPLDWVRKQNPLSDVLMEKYGRDDLIATHSHPYIYLNNEAIEEDGLDAAEVERFVLAEFMKLPGIKYGLTRSDVLAGRVPNAPLAQRIMHSFNPERSGNIHLVQEQDWLFHSTEEAEKLGVGELAAIHGSPWRYDTYVPILFAGPGVPNLEVSRQVAPYDIAPTVANYLGIKPPSGSVGEVLVEVVD
ncbi:MAG: alkaline phosphatase family protein [Gammaproteobacteria bacterium]